MRNLIIGMAMILTVSGTAYASGVELVNSMSFKITIVENGIEHEWEYHNPDEYEYEKDRHVFKGNTVKKDVHHMFELLDVSEKADVNQMVSRLKKNGYENMERLDVRWINEKNELYTWVWQGE